MTSHVAPGQAAGYLYQCRYALLAALHQHPNPQLAITIEHLDDVAFEQDAEPIARLQTKHHLTRAASLTDTCPDLWKTLAIWSNEVATDPAKLASQKLMLITTAQAPADSAASFLRVDGRNEERARDLLHSASSKSESRSNAPHYGAFGALASETQLGLLRAVQILDGSPSLTDLETPLRHELRLLAPSSTRSVALQRVEGWWWGRVAEALVNPQRKHIAMLELETCLDSVRESLRSDSLPIDFADVDPPKTTASDYDRRVFVHQLGLVDCPSKSIVRAKRDYYRAFEQRSKWSRDFLILHEELTAYERRLVEQWEPRFDRITEELGADVGEDERCKRGRDLLYWVETDCIQPLRNVAEPYLTVGSYHMLADDRRVGWHPDFLSLTGSDSTSNPDEGEAS